VSGTGTCQTVTVTLQHDQTPLMVSYFLGKNAFTIADHAVAQVQTTIVDSCLRGSGSWIAPRDNIELYQLFREFPSKGFGRRATT
jgi:hypothetical protein